MMNAAHKVSIKFILLSVFLFGIIGIINPSFLYASNTSFALANYLPVTDKNVSDGAIVSFTPKGYFLSKSGYDPLSFGVVTSHPAISLQVQQNANTYPVVSTGDTLVQVTTINGDIKKDDPITTSQIPGSGMKATQTGYIIGVSLENYASNNKKQVKLISVRLNFHYNLTQSSVKSGFFDVLNASTFATYQEPIKAFQYVVAAVVVILSFVMSFFLFARTANKGIEALGRNPLASKMIQVGIFLNVAIAISIVVAGIIVAFIVLKL